MITKSTTLALTLLGEEYYIWHGMLGYDTRPYFAEGRRKFYLPVAYTEGHAAGYREGDGETIPEGDVLGALRDAPNGTVLVRPEYYGAHLDEMDTRYIRVANGWKQLT